MYLTGVLQALAMVLITAFFNIYIKFCVNVFDIKPIFFAFVYFIATAWSLLIVAGPGKFAFNTIKDPLTWVYGILLIALSAVNLYLVKYISGTELAILGRLSVPVAIVSAFIFFRRAPKLFDVINLFIILGAISSILFIQTENIQIIINIAIVAAIIQFAQFLMAEIHSQSKASHEEGDLRDRMRVAAFATFATSVILFVLTVISSILIVKFNSDFAEKYLPFIPNVSDFSHLPTVISAIFFGVIISPFMRYFQWSSAYKIKTENVLTILALVPITTLLFEYIGSLFGIVTFENLFESSRGIIVLFVTVLLTIGSLLAAYIRLLGELKSVEGKNIWMKLKNSSKIESENLAIGYSANNMADYEVIKNTLDFYEGDEVKASQMLDIPIDTIKTLSLTKNIYSLRTDISKKVHKIFRNKIFYLDQLTGVENKKGLIRKFAELKENNIKFKLFYMDINKFKQINDTHGHNIGDMVIISIVHKIRDYAIENNGFAYRLGGDEFAFITTSKKPTETISFEIKSLISQPIKCKENDSQISITPSISIGKANIIKDANMKIKDLIKSADKNMYKDKQSSKDT